MTIYRLGRVLCIIKCCKPRSCAARMMDFCHDEAPCAPRNLYNWTQYLTHLHLNKIFRMMSPLPLENVPLFYQKICMGDLAVHHLKASIQVRLVESKVCFISDSGNWWGGWQTSVQKPIPHPAWQAGSENFYRQDWGSGVTCRNSTVISNSHLQLVISGLTSITLVLLVQFSSVAQ